MQKKKKNETNKTNAHKIHTSAVARATNYHPSKHSSMAMSRADIFINSAPSPTSTLNHRWAIECHNRMCVCLRWHCFIDALQCLCFSVWRARTFFSLASVIVIRQKTHKNGYNSFCRCAYSVFNTGTKWSILDTCQNVFASCIAHTIPIDIVERSRAHLQILNMKNWLSSHCFRVIQGCTAHENEFFVNAMAQMLCLPSIKARLSWQNSIKN